MSANNPGLHRITSVFDISGLDPSERVVLMFIRYVTAKHGTAFPSYETIAKHCGIVRRTAINVVKRLVEKNQLAKEHRYKIASADQHEGKSELRQLSNTYSSVESEEIALSESSNSLDNLNELSQNSPYKASSLKSIITEEDNKYTYVPFDSQIKRYQIPNSIKSAILDYISVYGDIRQFSSQAISLAFAKGIYRIKSGVKFVNFPKWIATTIRNEEFIISQKTKRTWEDVLERARIATATLN